VRSERHRQLLHGRTATSTRTHRKFYTDGDAGYDELVGCLTKDPEIPEQRCLAFALLHRGRAQRLAGL